MKFKQFEFSFPSSRGVAILRIKSSVSLFIHSWSKNNWICIFPTSISAMWNATRFELDWACLLPMTITITLQAPIYVSLRIQCNPDIRDISGHRRKRSLISGFVLFCLGNTGSNLGPDRTSLISRFLLYPGYTVYIKFLGLEKILVELFARWRAMIMKKFCYFSKKEKKWLKNFKKA